VESKNNKTQQEEVSQAREKNKSCLIKTLIFLVVFSYLVLVGIAVGVLTSFIETWDNSYNWARFLYGSEITLAIVVLIIVWSNLIVKILSPPDED
jgi:hypothetical protein